MAESVVLRLACSFIMALFVSVVMSQGASAQGVIATQVDLRPLTAEPSSDVRVVEIPYAWSSTAIAGLDQFRGTIPVQAKLEDVRIQEQPGSFWGRLITFTIGLAGGMFVAGQFSGNAIVLGLGAIVGGIMVPAAYMWAVGYGS